ncbi:MAG: cell wall-binding repeat-containing protein, partial [Eggerthella sp.]|nr:cell wall-binding repeat-containing protein [Eggerthella sp.]
MSKLGVSHAIVVGGQSAVSEQVVSDLKAAGATSVERLGGDTRYGTQMEIYRYGKDRSLWDGSTAIVANGSGSNFADALSASPVAFA